jgi:hypothetical protein
MDLATIIGASMQVPTSTQVLVDILHRLGLVTVDQPLSFNCSCFISVYCPYRRTITLHSTLSILGEIMPL